MKSNNKNRKKPSNRYELGSFVTQNAEMASQYQAQVNALQAPRGDKTGKGAMSGMAAGASLGAAVGTAIPVPIVGTAIGAVVGGLGGLLFGSSADKKERKRYNAELNKLNEQRSNMTRDFYESSIDTYNENPYGVYAEGGDVKKNSPKISGKIDKSKVQGGHVFEGMEEIITKGANYLNKKITGKNKISDNFNLKSNYLNNIIDNPGEILGSPGLGFTKSGIALGKGALGKYQKSLIGNKGYYTDAISNIVDVLDPTKYEEGGDVEQDPIINIEKGELQVDPETGKILREFTGINPETGGMYEKHNKKGKDTQHNMVTAKEGSFIITKKEGEKYKKAIENNDKFFQNAIMSNIRNQKRTLSNKFADGGFVDPFNLMRNTPRVSTQSNPINYLGYTQGASSLNSPINIPSRLTQRAPNVVNSNIKAPMNLGSLGSNILSGAMNYLPSIMNMVQGSKQANTLPYTPARMNVENRQRILNNLPQDVSVNPALNNIRGARSRAYRGINNSTSNPTIARANKLAMESNFLNAENEAIFNNQLLNNQVRGQRASILSGLDAQDNQRTMQNIGLLNDTFMTNRRMQQAKTDQFNYGLSQAQQMFQNNRTNRDKRAMQDRELEILRQVFPALGQYYPSLTGGR